MRKFLFALTFVLSIFMATNTRADEYSPSGRTIAITILDPFDVTGFQQKSIDADAEAAAQKRQEDRKAQIDAHYTNRAMNKVADANYWGTHKKWSNTTETYTDSPYGTTYADQEKITTDIKKIIENVRNNYAEDGSGSGQAMADFRYYSKSLNPNHLHQGLCGEGKNGDKKLCFNTAKAYLQEISNQAYQTIITCNAELDKMPNKTDGEKAARTQKVNECNRMGTELAALVKDMTIAVRDMDGSDGIEDLCLFGTAQVRAYDYMERVKTFYGISGDAHGNSLLGAELKAVINIFDGCWFCPIFEKIFDLINELATRLYSLLSEWFQALLAIMGFAAILFMVGKFFLTFHGTNIGQEYTNLFQMIGRMMLAFALLHASVGEVFGLFIRPFFSFTGALVDAINAVEAPAAGGLVISLSQINISHTGNCTADQLKGIAKTSSSPAVVESMCMSEVQNPYDDIIIDNQKAAFDNTMRSTLLCMLRTTSMALVTGIATASGVWELSNEKGFAHFDFIPNINMLIFGLVQMIAFLYLYIMTPIKLLDVLIRFGFVAIMMPLWIVFWVFKTTRGYTKKAWDIVMTSLFYLVSLTIMLLLALKILGV